MLLILCQFNFQKVGHLNDGGSSGSDSNGVVVSGGISIISIIISSALTLDSTCARNGGYPRIRRIH